MPCCLGEGTAVRPGRGQVRQQRRDRVAVVVRSAPVGDGFGCRAGVVGGQAQEIQRGRLGLLLGKLLQRAPAVGRVGRQRAGTGGSQRAAAHGGDLQQRHRHRRRPSRAAKAASPRAAAAAVWASTSTVSINLFGRDLVPVEPPKPGVVKLAEAVADIRVQHPVHSPARDPDRHAVTRHAACVPGRNP